MTGPPTLRGLGTRAGYGAAVLALFLLAAEFTARLDDWVQDDTPLGANPDRERDLTAVEDGLPRGRPHGRFRKWKLNAFGFRGPEIREEPEPGRPRALILGASETFGLYEEEGKEYPAQLAALLQGDGIEVVNAALAGISLPTMTRYWDDWASRFRPAVVLIYPSPMLYLDDLPPGHSSGPGTAEEPSLAERVRDASRLLTRFQDLARSAPRWLRKWREDYSIARRMDGRSEDWYFREVPADRLKRFAADLGALADAVEARGARPVLVTHACRAQVPPTAEDLEAAHAMRMFFVRPTAEVILAFERAANEEIRRLGRCRCLAVVDADVALSGHPDWFADLVHFTDAGSEEMARLLAARLREIAR
jgi:lysophospholipase L1-like esterase